MSDWTPEQRKNYPVLTGGLSDTDLLRTRASIRQFTLEQIEGNILDSGGFCTACGEEAYNVEPDASNYECESCGEREVFGSEQLVIMGLVK